MIAMLFIIMMYSAAIPVLYVSGFLICLTMYWSDKALFLRHYRLPPRYGRDLAKRAIAIMEYAIILHMIIGCYMLSNETIFSYTRDKTLAEYTKQYYEDGASVVEETEEYADFLKYVGSTFYGTDEKRFKQVHTKFYMTGIFLFLLFFLLERFNLISTCMKKICLRACLRTDIEPSFSSDIFNDISMKDKRSEYHSNKDEIRLIEYKLAREDRDTEKDSLLMYYREKLR